MSLITAEVKGGIELLREQVLSEMLDMGFHASDLQELRQIPLGWLRRDATQRHGVTRFHPGVDLGSAELGPSNIRIVDLHRSLVKPEWWRYGQYVLYHEYCHCLGHPGHGRGFKALEARWRDEEARGLGKKLTDELRLSLARWIWMCPSCEKGHPRRKKSNGRFLCRICNVALRDVPGQV